MGTDNSNFKQSSAKIPKKNNILPRDQQQEINKVKQAKAPYNKTTVKSFQLGLRTSTYRSVISLENNGKRCPWSKLEN